MDVKILAGVLFTGHVIALVVTVRVLMRQVVILRSRPDPELQTGRLVLFALAVVIGLGNIIPMAIDAAVILGEVPRAKPNLIGVLYALSNVLTLIFSASAVLALYMIAERLFSNTRARIKATRTGRGKK